MKVLVINAPFISDFCRNQRWPARTRGRAIRPPDWLAYVTGILKKDKIDAKLYDFPAMKWDKKSLRRLIVSEKPDFVILDSTTPSIYSDIECAGIVKENSSAHVIMVGPHISALPEETLRLAGNNVDVLALGEFDYTIRDILINWGNLGAVKGICYPENDRVRFTAPRNLIEDLDSLPFPAWEDLDIRRYFDAGRLFPYINIIGGRGCPYQCTFCQWPQLMFGHKYRFRSSKNIVDEIEYDLKLFPGLKNGEFFFEDDTFTVNSARAFAICEEIGKRNLKINWSVNARPDIYDSKLFKEMKKTGCREFLVGFESGNQKILDNVKKGLKIEEIAKFVSLVKESGISIHGCFVLGLPGETRESAKETIDYAMGLDIDTLQFSAAVPLPGTEYFDYCRSNKLLKTNSWNDWLKGGEQGAIVDYPGLSISEINSLLDYGLKRFYFRTGYIVKFILKTCSLNDLYRKLRGGWNFLLYLFQKNRS